MNVTCPRCETIILAPHEGKRFTCPTCRARYCRQCKHWRDRGQKYCLECGLWNNWPPDAIHAALKQGAGLILFFTLLSALFYPLAPALHEIALVTAALGIYFAVYLARFQRSTSLRRAAQHEAARLLRQGVIWSSVAYFIIYRGQAGGMLVLVVGTVLATGLGLLLSNRLSARALDELRANRPAWKAVLGLRARDAFLMRFPSA